MARQSWLTRSGRLLVLGTLLLQMPGLSSQEAKKQNLSPDEIIKAFSAKETEFYEAWMQYSYRQIAEVKVVSVDGRPSRERLNLVSEIIFKDDGTREVKLVQKRGELRSVRWTPEDTEVLNNLQPFALTAKELPQYELKYEGKERVDELNCYVFSVKPKRIDDRKIYFQGKIWVDDEDLQVVRTIGKPVPQSRDNKYPDFETIRQIVDEKYWFPVWTHADSQLKFPGNTVHIEETITYEDYKRFGSKAKIDFGNPPPKPQ
jgi:outer membrane lipoprotein-sorting protein